jgi:hypothetical protein
MKYGIEIYRDNNGILEKRCSLHLKYFPNENEWFPCSEDYFYSNKSNKTDGLCPYCKECAKEKAANWKYKNIDKDNLPPITQEVLYDISERFWEKVDVRGEDDCWNWKATIGMNGYGQFSINYKLIATHRLSYLLHYGELPDDLLVCHTCDNRICVNPKHLFLGTHSENTLDAVAKGRWTQAQKSKNN